MTEQKKALADVMPKGERLLANIRALAEEIEHHAEANITGDLLDDALLRKLEETGIFAMMAPERVGGLEADPITVFEALKLLSYLDGSTGWYCQAGATGVAVAGSFLGERAIDAIFHSGRATTCAGQAAPTGRAERVGDGYRISGSFSFGSGIANAQWVVGGYVLHADGQPQRREDGSPVMLIAVTDRSMVELKGNWNVIGLRGTGSFDYTVAEHQVHADFAFDPMTDLPQRGGPLYRMGFFAIPALCHGAFGAGCGRRILDEWARHAQSKRRPTGTLVAEAEPFRRDFAVSHASLRAAEAYVRRTYDQLFATAAAGQSRPELQLDSRLAASNILSTGARVAQTAFTASATTGIRDGSVIQRCFRDMQAGNAHFLTGEQSFIDEGRDLLSIAAYDR